MKFWFCETCGKRLTDADIEAGAARDKKLKGVFCKDCAVGVLTMEMMPVSEAQARNLLKHEQNETPQGTPDKGSNRKTATVPQDPRKPARARPPAEGLKPGVIVAAAIGALVLAVGVGLSFGGKKAPEREKPPEKVALPTPAPGPVPAQIPVPGPAPIQAPASAPPAPVSQPTPPPEEVPAPAAAQNPIPAPAPDAVQAPEAEPVPTPTPVPEPAPAAQPSQVPASTVSAPASPAVPATPKPAAAPKPVALNEGLVLHWKLDDFTGKKAVDSSGNGNSGTLVDKPVWTVGRIKGALKFENPEDRVEAVPVNHNIGGGDFTWAVWVNPERLSNYKEPVLGNGQFVPGLYTRMGKDGQWGMIWSGDRPSGNTLTVGKWHHLAVVRQNDVISFYQDGVQTSKTHNIASAMPNAAFRIGTAGGTNYSKTIVDDVRFYSRALSEAEIAALAKPQK